MKAVYLLFVIFTGDSGHEELVRANDMMFGSVAACQAELEHYQNTKNMTYFCGDADLYVSKKQVFY